MTISEIAKLAGVSNAAVSRYFNDGYVSKAKKEAIRKVVEETGYTPSVQAQMLRTKKTRTIGVMVPRVASESSGSVIEGILNILNKENYHMYLAVTQNSPERELEYLRSFKKTQVDGLIFIATILTEEHKQAILECEVPVVVVGQYFPDFPSIYHDDYHAIYAMTRYAVVECGRKNPVYISAPLEDPRTGQARLHGFQDAMKDFGLEEKADRYLVSDYGVEDGFEVASELITKWPETDLVIAATDRIAAGARKKLWKLGYVVPRGIMVTGLGDSQISRVCSPSIPSIHFEYERSGELAVKMILERIRGKDPEMEKDICLGFHIVNIGDRPIQNTL